MQNSIIDLILKAGPVMYFLVACSLVSIWFIVDRLIVFAKVKNDKIPEILDSVVTKVRARKIDAAIEYCQTVDTPASRVYLAGLSAMKSKKYDPQSAMERQGAKEATALEEKLVTLGTLGNVAPFVGLFGTVAGVVTAFLSFNSSTSSGSMEGVYVGIGTALVATAAGLFVAIPSVVCYNYFSNFVTKSISRIEEGADEILLAVKK